MGRGGSGRAAPGFGSHWGLGGVLLVGAVSWQGLSLVLGAWAAVG